MVRKLTTTAAVLALTLGAVGADHHGGGEHHPPMAPTVILGPPEGFEPPENMPIVRGASAG